MEQKEYYQQVQVQLSALLEGEHDVIANMANCAALLYQSLPDVNWAGFYLWKQEELVLGPFQGKPACMHIPYGKGVCGTCVKELRVQCVKDVHQFPGHIACDGASRSEIVLPIFQDQSLLGVLDIDAPIPDRFDDVDADELAKIVMILENSWNTK